MGYRCSGIAVLQVVVDVMYAGSLVDDGCKILGVC